LGHFDLPPVYGEAVCSCGDSLCALEPKTTTTLNIELIEETATEAKEAVF
jgi:hypothetical protein